MNVERFDNQVLLSLRWVYRVTPVSEARKLSWVNALERLWPSCIIIKAAKKQVALELAASHLQMLSASNFGVPERALNLHTLAKPVASKRMRAHAGTRAVGYVPFAEEDVPPALPAKVIAFYLPQFHPIPENDQAWGAGFTEWTNVTRALPQVEGQIQPRLPGELGFYDLRLPAIQKRQVELAKQYGIGGFCFHFYWFGGKRLLETPLLQYLENTDCDLPFCLCWANENWTRRWDGCESDVLVAQNHSPDDDLAFITYIAKFFRDPRYIRVGGKPLLIVYRPALLPSPEKTALTWRTYCREAGLGEIYLVSTTSFEKARPSAYGFDALVEFAPNNSSPTQITNIVHKLNPEFVGNVYDWRCLVERSRSYAKAPYRLFRGVNPGWDNTPRKPDSGNIFLHASPRGYEEWLFNAVQDAVKTVRQADERFVFVNAWNEWAEGAYLEPDARLGYAYLAATRRALKRASVDELPAPRAAGFQRPICVVIHAFYPELLGEMFDRLACWQWPLRLVITCPTECRTQVLGQLEGRGFDAQCRVFENRGRDILPFLHVANELADAGEELVVKLHTKRSPHRLDGDTWRQDVLDKLLAPKHAKSIHAAFGNTPRLGIVGPEGHVLPLSFYWGSNEANVQYLCRIMGVPEVDADAGVFCAGSMFWARVSALRPLLDAYLDEASFEIEAGQVDGTLAHAVERCLAPAARSVGYFLASSASPSVPAIPLDEEYDYAESSRAQAAVSTDP